MSRNRNLRKKSFSHLFLGIFSANALVLSKNNITRKNLLPSCSLENFCQIVFTQFCHQLPAIEKGMSSIL